MSLCWTLFIKTVTWNFRSISFTQHYLDVWYEASVCKCSYLRWTLIIYVFYGAATQFPQNLLLTEVYKYIHGLSPEIMNEVFSTSANICNTRQFNVFETYIPTSNRYGLYSIPYKANQHCNLIPEKPKSSLSLTLFKNEISLWQFLNSPCNICKSYVPNLGYWVSRN